ncbi:RNA polymerase sigma factor [Veronia pacifica]|uniref:RNA polymerase sigma-70 region 2 domain-containing protein n=1 Tax=Veronia pacifica TaxID=1080227 RepID=A0A1C3EMT5_9GAMM|nr:RNA polymerase sigma factor [Veronia pacifica]ODA34519.1 hypothetical protein A8L45_05995 [Veronia pacifica]
MFTLSEKKNNRRFSKPLLNSLYRYAFSLCHNEAQAFDLVQICCEKILRVKEAEKQTKKYMLSVIRNSFIDQCRKEQLEFKTHQDLFPAYDVSECAQIIESLDAIIIDQQHVSIIMDKVSHRERELLYLWAVEGLTFQEIAYLTDQPRGTLLSKLSRLKKRLTRQFSYLFERVSE